MKDDINVGFINVHKVHSGSHTTFQAILKNQNKWQGLFTFKAALRDFHSD